MKTSRFSESQIVAILNQASSGVPVPALCRERTISSSMFYKWRSKYGGMDASMLCRMKELEAEFSRLYADKSIQNELLKEALGKKFRGQLDLDQPSRGRERREPRQRWTTSTRTAPMARRPPVAALASTGSERAKLSG